MGVLRDDTELGHNYIHSFFSGLSVGMSAQHVTSGCSVRR